MLKLLESRIYKLDSWYQPFEDRIWVELIFDNPWVKSPGRRSNISIKHAFPMGAYIGDLAKRGI